MINTIPKIEENVNVSMASAAAVSSAIDLRHATLFGLYLPAGFVGTGLTFLVATSLDGTYRRMKDRATGAALTAVVASPVAAPGDYIPLSPSDFGGVRFVKIESNQPQASALQIELATRAAA
jgi:hypothetical protein